jgi:hypothetical protein
LKEADAPAQCLGILDMMYIIWANNMKIITGRLSKRIKDSELYRRPQEHSTWMDETISGSDAEVIFDVIINLL